MKEAVLNVLFFFGLGLAGLIVLVLSALFSRKAISLILWGIVASGFFVLECVLLSWMAGIGSATSGSQRGYQLGFRIAAFFAVCLALYCYVAFKRLRRK
jgi:hypothetical protein